MDTYSIEQKLNTEGKDSNRSMFLTQFNSLNRSEWEQLIVDVSKNSPWVSRVFGLKRQEEVITAFTDILADLDFNTRKQIESIMNRLWSATSNDYNSKKFKKYILELTFLLDWGVSDELLKAEIRNRKSKPWKRLLCADVLSKSSQNHYNFWKSLSIDEEPQFIVPFLQAVYPYFPEHALFVAFSYFSDLERDSRMPSLIYHIILKMINGNSAKDDYAVLDKLNANFKEFISIHAIPRLRGRMTPEIADFFRVFESVNAAIVPPDGSFMEQRIMGELLK